MMASDEHYHISYPHDEMVVKEKVLDVNNHGLTDE